MNYPDALRKARRLAKAGPRVAAVVRLFRGKDAEWDALPGYACDADNPEGLRFRQVALVDPDGVVYTRNRRIP
jgi:hypothetical protein